jgi:hypothetical protein
VVWLVHHSNFEVRNNSVGRKLVVCYSIVSSLNAGKYLAVLSYLLTCHQDKHKGNYPVLVQAMNSEKLSVWVNVLALEELTSEI